MCVLAFAWQAHPRWVLVAAANRDERHDRAAAPLARWGDLPSVIAGRDLASGGTWLGVSEQGRFAAVTNLRGFGPPDPERTSRGALVASLLTGQGRYAVPNEAPLQDCNPFNAIAIGPGGAWFLANQPQPVQRQLAPGVYGLSNGPLDEPWPKTQRLKERLSEWMALGDPLEALLGELRDDVPVSSGFSSADAAPPASIFVLDPIYGTRCSTVAAIDARGQGLIIERRYAADGQPAGQSQLAFRWPR